MTSNQTPPLSTGNDEERLWTIEEVAQFLIVSVPTLYGWRHRGRGPQAMRIGKHLRYEPNVVRTWARAQVA